jgi:phosphoribosylglycinamide formyltransferase-1
VVVKLGVLISGRGSNLQALIEATAAARLSATIRLVISNRPEAMGLIRAAAAGIETAVLPHRDFPSRASYDHALVERLQSTGVDYVCLAGFMRLLGPTFCAAFPSRIVNIHPSLLPAFPGVDAQRQAFEHGVKVTGATVHLVTPELDAGPIVMQRAVTVHDDDTVETLSSRILGVEHELYPEAVQRLVTRSWSIVGRRVVFALQSASQRTEDVQ